MPEIQTDVQKNLAQDAHMQIHAAAKKRISVNRKTNIHLLKK